MNGLRIFLSRLAWLSYLLGLACRHGPILLVLAFLLSPIGPHMRWDLGYGPNGSCIYVGARGFFVPTSIGTCPFLAWLDSREGKQ